MLMFKRFHHVVLAVKDVTAAAATWEKVFNGKGIQPEPLGDRRAVRFGVGDAWIELAQPLTQDSPLGQFLERTGGGVFSVGVDVEDVALVARKARQMGATVLGDENRPGPVPLDPASVNGVPLSLHDEGERFEGRPIFKRFHHIVVATRDHKGSITHWEHVFGTRPHPEGPDRQVHRNHIPVGDAWFGLTDVGTDAEAVTRFLDRRGEGVYLLSVVVDDVKRAAARVREGGGRIIGNENGPGQVFVHPSTTHGVLLELADDTIRMWPDEA